MIRVALVWLCLALPAAAQELPDWDYTSINDFAGLLTNEDIQVLDRALIALHDETGVEGTVVTIEDRARYGGADGLEPFATRLFNDWGVGDARRDDGFMVLVSQGDREVRIELGAGYPASADQAAQRIIDDRIIPEIRADHMSRGIRDGTLDVIQSIARPVAAGDLPGAPHNWADRITGSLSHLLPIGFIGFVLFRIFGRHLARWRRAREVCPKCGSRELMDMTETREGARITWRRCPSCGWTGPERSLPAARGRGGFARGGLRGSGRRSGRGGGFGGGRSSGGGASGRW
ncbi:TPM domain-containing protein [Paracoccus sp. TK19116]|uniref:TPM domain-containing protein n=1 Tax=Paracoccus albicereus TaxID=2922394 RepID=A0ABT1MTZ3_9RHOB|nr:TPM domain-containing protein [Paracoccus albicereus]MCQ0971149.1 TPM domain-containing protein [Paracoccus albicereus]